MDNFVIIVPIVAVIISYFWMRLFGKDKKVEVIERIDLPEGYSFMELGMIYSETASAKEVAAMLIDLANKGYLRVP